MSAMTTVHDSILRFDAVTRTHINGGANVRVLGPVSFDIRPGEFVAVMGPSGSGKSTLLALAGALDRPSEGRVLLQGRELASLNSREIAAVRRRVIGFVFQDLNLLPGLTALENVSLPLELDGRPLFEAKSKAMEKLELVGLAALANRFPDDMSGGERQRVAIARACVGPRRLLLADEPTGALDSLTGESIMRLLRAECDGGRTAMVVTHNSAHAAWADRVLFLRDGNIVNEVASAVNSSRIPSGDEA